ncbi:MAG: hypothetical protein AB7H90_22195 [Alphaproteobacteria bacterium]
MLFFVVGLPGGFTEWCGALTAALAGKPGRPAAPIEAETLQDLAASVIKAGEPHSTIVSCCPGGRLRGALAETGRDFVVALDDLRSALLDLVLWRGLDLAQAVRLLASSCGSVIGCSLLPGALVLTGDEVRAQPAATAAAVARHLGIACDGDTIAALTEELGAEKRRFQGDDAIAWWNGLDQAQRQMAIGALAPYLDPDPIGGVLPITWTGDLFIACGRPEQAASAPIDITGRARRLIDGPGIILPVGAWSLTLTLSCNRAAAEYEFLVEVTAGLPLAAATLRPEAEGSAAIRIDFDIDHATDHPVAIRVGTVRAAFDGVVSLLAASLVRATPAAPNPP